MYDSVVVGDVRHLEKKFTDLKIVNGVDISQSALLSDPQTWPYHCAGPPPYPMHPSLDSLAKRYLSRGVPSLEDPNPRPNAPPSSYVPPWDEPHWTDNMITCESY